MNKILLVVDYQNDFVTGSLGFESAKKLDEGIVNKINEYINNNDSIIVTKDCHGPDYLETQEGKNLPIPHCIENTKGEELYGNTKETIYNSLRKENSNIWITYKDTFGSKQLFEILSNNFKKTTEIEIVGVVTNMCVIANAIICKTVLPNAKIIINSALCDSFDKKLHQEAIDVMKSMQMTIL